MKNKKLFLSYLQYLLVGLILSINGMLSFKKYPVAGILTVLLGTVIISISFLIKTGKLKFSFLKPIALLAEGIGLIIVGYIYDRNGSVWLPYLSYLAAGLYFIAALVKIKNFSTRIESDKIE